MPHIFGEASRNRQASKVKFKIVRFSDGLRLLVTAPNENILKQAQSALKGKLCKPETWQPLQ